MRSARQSQDERQFQYHSFDKEKLQQAINLLSYGVNLIKHRKKGKPEHRLMYIFEDDPSYLQYFKPGKSYVKSRIPLIEIDVMTVQQKQEIKDKPTNELFKHLLTENILQLSYSNKKIVLEFEDKDQRDLWWQGLEFYIGEAHKSMASQGKQDFADIISKKMFFLGDTDGSKSLSLEEVRRVLKQMHVEVPDVKRIFKLTALFNEHDVDKSGTIEYEEFLKIVKKLLTYDEMKPIFMKYSSYCRGMQDINPDVGLMSKNDFHHFLTQVQKQTMTQIELSELFAQYSQESPQYNQQRLISFSSFTSYLMNSQNRIYRPEKLINYQDMSRPLTDYWINSSHNTYLMSNQLTGQSSIDAYINALQKGCRCVELDCWDGPNGYPIIFHGYTMTTKITFESVIQCLKEYAFKYSKYPLILSLEVHCQIEQQDRMAEIMQEHFGDSILTVPLDWNTTEYYPSPDELQNKIILKGKGNIQAGLNFRLGRKERSRSVSGNEMDDDDNGSDKSVEGHVKNRTKAIMKLGLQSLVKKQIQEIDEQKEIDIINKRILDQLKLNIFDRSESTQQTNSKKFSSLFKDPYETCDVEEPYDDQRSFMQKTINSSRSQVSLRPKYKNSDSKTLTFNNLTGQTVRNLTEEIEVDEKKKKAEAKVKDSIKLVALTTMFGISMNLTKPRSVWEISSLDENKLLKLVQTKEKQLLDFHKKHFTRIYPAGARVDSSNYDPIPSYCAGSQIVALNFQTNDLPMLINSSKFLENGGLSCGYLLKPEWMLHDAIEPKIPSDFKTVQKNLSFHIISGQNLKNHVGENIQDIIDPFVRVTLRGTSIDESANPPGRSATIQNNGLNPKFDFKFKAALHCPELAMVVIEVFDEDMMQNNFIGWAAISINCIRQGYRNIQLMGKNLKPIQDSLLFVFVEIENVLQL